ncbi:hypothetical protein CMQ_5089 [Grosmannia clavigera kw1407]|uniref:C6 zinc finger domain containing protein n=1 Tax=Grosmannia clavigera (strain kw1407 / UAMH 11150) TaxID=655863 RepID=F0XK65_GROCL|nr:uncharacterized protein CMQ_5089 [Grosmannia clavigera kw1407]EFX02018.1 hypothetical protein CMQ_5089 [Grosmannia clavigera kw1407]
MLSVWPGRDGLEGSNSNSSSGLGKGAGAKRGAGVMSSGVLGQVSPLTESTTAGDENDSGWENAGIDSDSMGAAGPDNRRTTDAGVAAAWSAALGVFSVAPLPVQFRRVAAMTPFSSAMLRRYIVSTAAALATTCGADNPFLAAVLPLAYTDDLVMHCVIALGGADLSSSSSSSSSSNSSRGKGGGKDKRPMGPCSDNENAVAICRRAGASPSALHEATTRHYACVLRSLRAALRDLQPTDTARVLRTLLVLVLLAVFEGTSWNVLDGGVFAHLGASRQLIAWLRPELSGTRTTTTTARGATSTSAIPTAVADDERSMLGALLEVYAYLVLANRVTPDGTMDSRRVVGPDGSTADEDFVLDPSMLADQHYFGVLFAGMHDLFGLIPPVSRLAGDAAAVASAAAGRPEAVHADAVALRNRARAWQLPAACLAQAAGDQDRTWWRAIGEVYRHALLVYIETAELWAGSSCMGPAGGEDEGEDEGERSGVRKPITGVASLMEATIQRHIHAVGEATLGDDLVHSRFVPIILWPLMIIGSILASTSQRAYLVDGLRNAPPPWSLGRFARSRRARAAVALSRCRRI